MSSSQQRRLDQGISASRAGGAQKRPPAPSKASPSKRPRAPLPSPSIASTSRRSGDDSATDTGSVASKVRRRTREAAEPKWAPQIDQLLLDRTLRLHTLSPLHLSSLPASAQEVAPQLFALLRSELQSYINLRLSDGFGFLEAGTTINTRDPDSGDLRPPERRRRAETDRVGHVRIGFIDDAEFSTALDAKVDRAWAIEIELGKPAEDATTKLRSVRAKAHEVSAAELCQIVFVPASRRQRGQGQSRSYPLIATKSPSGSTGADPLVAATGNVGPVVLGHALDWIQKRFDCRIAAPTGAAGIAARLSGHKLEALAELIVRETRAETGTANGRRTQEQIAVDQVVKPVELVFGFPTTVRGATPDEVLAGPAPDLGSLTLTVPWEICMNLLDGLDSDEPLLPALNHYLAVHTSIPLDKLELTRIGIAGISVGAGRIKIAKLPDKEAAPEKRSLLKRGQEKGAARVGDRRRAAKVLAFLRQVVEGTADDDA